MLKIKLLDGNTTDEIEELVNNFIKYEKLKIIDIKMNMTGYGCAYRFTATILYENILEDTKFIPTGVEEVSNE